MQDENLGSELSLHVEIKFAPGDDEVLHSNHSPQGAVLLQTEEMQSINAIEASPHDRPPAINPEDNQPVEGRKIGQKASNREGSPIPSEVAGVSTQWKYLGEEEGYRSRYCSG